MGVVKLLYANDKGRIISEEELNLMTPQEIESEGIHLVSDWDEWN